MTGIRAALMSIHLLILLVAPAVTAAGVPAMALQPLSRDDWRSVGVGGTGCWWRYDKSDGWRLAMSGHVAVVRIAGGNVALAPAPGALELFPFTFDRWQADGTTVRVVPAKVARQSGVETLDMPTQLVVTVDGASARLAGIMRCGS